MCFGINSIYITGVLKINVQISNWPFCGFNDVICKECVGYVVGKYLDLEIAVEGTSPARFEDTYNTSGAAFNVGKGELLFSEKVCT